MKQIRSVLVPDESISAGAVSTYDLPVNALSHIIFTLKCLNVTDEATLAEILARIDKISITRLGQTQLDLSFADLWALNVVMFRGFPLLANRVATDNAVRHISLIIPFGRRLFDPTECHPKTTKGEFKMQITLDSTETACDGVIYQVETVELPGAAPKRYLKATTISDTPAATGEMDIELPRGNQLVNLLLWATTIPTTTAWTATIDWIKLLVDNVEAEYAKSFWESLHNDLQRRVNVGDYIAAAAGADALANYSLMEFDPKGDDSFLVETKGLSSLKVRINAGDTNALRVIPIELVTV